MPPLSIMIKPVSGLCNMSCTYCFYKDVTKNRKQELYGVMSLETLENTIRKTLDYAEGMCSFVFQGGEPTLAGLDFFINVVKLQKKYNYKRLSIYNSIQTNGYEINKDWAEFFHKNNFLVGLSIDGIESTHDAYRVDKHGKGTHKKIMETVALLNEYKVEFNILTVVNSKTARHIQDIYSFYKNSNLKYLQFIPCLDPFGSKQGDKKFSLTAKQYEEFLKALFDLWYQDIKTGNYIYIRYFENLVGLMIGYSPESCGMAGVCTTQYVVEADGGVYPCDFYVLDEWKMGNMNIDCYHEIDKQQTVKKFIELSKCVYEKCKRCKYFSLCRGGCKRNREKLNNGEYGNNVLCEAFQGFFGHALPRLQELAIMAKGNKSNL